VGGNLAQTIGHCQRHRPWRVTRETCEKGATWTDWTPTLSRPSRQSRLAILRDGLLGRKCVGR